jgi:hypothetical protein
VRNSYQLISSSKSINNNQLFQGKKMTIKKSGILVTTLAVLFSVALASGALALTISGTLRGTDGNPVMERMRVGATSDFENWTNVETANGQYSITNLNPGGYFVRAEAVNANSWYYMVYYPEALSEEGAEMIFLFEGDQAGIDITMSPGGRFSGSITPAEGGQLPQNMAQIQVFDDPQNFFNPLFEFETDQASNYSSPIIPAGSYLVRFIPPPMNDHVSMYYGDALSAGDAAWVTIDPASTTRDISAALPLGGRITGSARFGDVPLPGTIAIAILVDNSAYTIIGIGGADQQANYTIYGVPAGLCYVQFIPPAQELSGQWYRRAYSFQDATPVEVAAGEVTEDIDAEFERGAELNGTILLPDGSPVGQGMVNIILMGRSDLFTGNRGIEMTADGVWSTAGTVPPGVYGIEVEWLSDPTAALQFYNNATHPWDAEWMFMGTGMNTPPLAIQLREAGSISGTVSDPSRQGVEDIEMALMDDFGEFRWTRSGVDGVFEMGNIPSGRYYLMASPEYLEGRIDPENALVTTFSGNGFIRRTAERFDVAAGQNTEINITLARGGVMHVTATGPGGRFYDMIQDGVGIVPLAVDNNGTPSWDAASTSGNDGPPAMGAEGMDIALPPGSYTVAGLPIFIGTNIDDAPGVRRTFLGGGFGLQGAGRVNVVAGQTVDAAIQMVETGHSISGSARTAEGKPGMGITASVDADGFLVNAYIPTFTGFADPSGNYTLKGLPNGSYRLLNWPSEIAGYMISTWFPNVGDAGREPENLVVPNGAQQVAVNNADVPNTNITVQLAAHYTGVEPERHISPPTEFALNGVFPNPFNSSAIILFSLNRSSEIKLSLTDLLGREVAVLSEGRYGAGRYSARLNGESLSNGVYFARLEADGFKAVTKVVLMK